MVKYVFLKNKGEATMFEKFLKTALCLVLFVSLFACSTFTPAQEATPTPNPAAGGTRPALTDPAQPIEVQAGETFHIVVDSNPSTGYHWEIVGELNGVEFVSRDYTADEPVAPGSGGVDVWTFNAVSAGQAQITLGSYPPGVDGGEPEQTVTFDVTVK
jgi:inhibitor of cysteine peptidase